MRDAVELEWAGIPSVAVVHHSMVTTARAMARVSGMTDDYRYLTVDYPRVPLAVWTADEIAETARDLAPRVVALLTAPPDGTGPTGTVSQTAAVGG